VITKGDRNEARKRRHFRVRRKIEGTAKRPRLSVFRSDRHIYAQLIDDESGQTLVSASSLDSEVIGNLEGVGGNVSAAQKVGTAVAERALAKGYAKVVFDRGGYLYHGRIQALADAAREAGLEF